MILNTIRFVILMILMSPTSFAAAAEKTCRTAIAGEPVSPSPAAPGTVVLAQPANPGILSRMLGWLPGAKKAAPSPAVNTSQTTEVVPAASAAATKVSALAQMTTAVQRYAPLLDQPIKLEGAIPPYHGGGTAFAETTYREYLTPDVKVLWETTPYTGFELVNGSQVVAARIYEHFGFLTSQPRVAKVENTEVILRKRMDAWRKTPEGLKIEHTNLYSESFDSSLYRELYFVSAFLDDPLRIGSYSNSEAGQSFWLNEFGGAFGAGYRTAGPQIETKVSARAILEEISVADLPLRHPWRSLNEADIAAFKTKLAGLTDALIRKMVQSGRLNDPNAESKLIAVLISRRDMLLAQLSVADLPAPVSAELLAAAQRISREEKYPVIFDRDKVIEYYGAPERLALIPDYEFVLTAFAKNEFASFYLASTSFDFLSRLQRYGRYQFSSTMLADLLIHLLASDPHAGRSADRSHAADLGAEIFREMLASTNPEPVAFLGRVMVANYQRDPARLQNFLKPLWRISDERSTNQNAELRARLPQLHAVGADAASEILLLSFVSHALDHAEHSDRALGGGGGFHNAKGVNAAVLEGADAIRYFLSLNLHRSEITARINLLGLAEALEAMPYDSLGRRKRGQGITAHEAFGLGGARRVDKYNIYQILRNVICGHADLLAAEDLQKPWVAGLLAAP